MFGERLRSLRKIKGWTQQDLSRELAQQGFKMSQANLSLLEKSIRAPRESVLRQLCTCFGVAVEYWYEDDYESRKTQIAEYIASLSDRQSGNPFDLPDAEPLDPLGNWYGIDINLE